jgi:hypothetical protein
MGDRPASLKGTSKAQFVSVRVAYVEVSLSPWSIGGCHFRFVAGAEGTPVHGINVLYPEHDATPDLTSRPVVARILEVQKPGSGPKARELRVGPSVEQSEAETFIE